MRIVILACLLALTLAACGTKGALFLPPPEPPASDPAKEKSR